MSQPLKQLIEKLIHGFASIKLKVRLSNLADILFSKTSLLAGFFASLISIVGFLGQKPMIQIGNENFFEWCSPSQETVEFLNTLQDLNGNVVYANFYIDTDLYDPKDPGPVDKHVEQEKKKLAAQAVENSSNGCPVADVSNFSNPQDWGNSITGLSDDEYFVLQYQEKLLSEAAMAAGLSGDPDSYGDVINLVLPRLDRYFVLTDHCKNTCYSIEGPVLVKTFSGSEATSYVSLIPVNVHQNSFMQSRYECRLTVNMSSFWLLGWLKCLV